MLLLENPRRNLDEELYGQLRHVLEARLAAGVTALWMTGEEEVFLDPSLPATARYRCRDSQLLLDKADHEPVV